MPGPLGLIRRFGGNVIGNATSYAMGAATADTLRPELQSLVNETNKLHPVRPPAVGTLAIGVAQGQIDLGQATDWAAEQGFGADAFGALVHAADTGPGVPVAFDLWRRNITDEAGFRRACKRQGLEPEWIDDLVRIKQNVLDQVQLANAIHRGLIASPPGLLLGHTPGPGRVESYPVYPIDALAEAEAHGYDHDHLGVLVGLAGLPMGSHEAAQATFRAVIDKEDFYRAIAEGNTRNEWADAIFDQSRQIPTVHDYIELHLRNYKTLDEMHAGAARHGMTPADVDDVFNVTGRPLSFHQVFIGERRGGTLDGPTAEISPAFLDSLRKSNIRPEYYDLAWSQRFVYPSLFALRSLATSGAINEAELEQVLLYEGWEPTFAKRVATALTTTATMKADPWVGKAETKAWTETQKAYIGGSLNATQAGTALTVIGVPAASQTRVLELWDLVRRVEATNAAVPAPAPL